MNHRVLILCFMKSWGDDDGEVHRKVQMIALVETENEKCCE
jgi:hypothetical protein